jgi:nucleotide-binding universal stress UspA family protein
LLVWHVPDFTTFVSLNHNLLSKKANKPMASKKFLVPHDFTSVADTALNHALKVAKTTGGSVHLLHVVGKPGQVDEAREKLQQLADFSNWLIKPQLRKK